MISVQRQCSEIAVALKRQSLSMAVSVALSLAAAIGVLILASAASYPWFTTLLMIIATLAALITLALSALLRFDATLFTMMASYDDETAACAAVDDFLARAKLKPLPATTRPAAERIAGARRLMARQRIAATVFAITAVLALAANFA